VALTKHPSELATGTLDTSWDDQSCIAQVDEANLATVVDTPPTTEFGGEDGLTSTRDLGIHCSRHVVHYRSGG
jgi:hypothetical protein